MEGTGINFSFIVLKTFYSLSSKALTSVNLMHFHFLLVCKSLNSTQTIRKKILAFLMVNLASSGEQKEGCVFHAAEYSFPESM